MYIERTSKREMPMFTLQALQMDGTWYAISTHATARDADDEMRSRAAWRRGAVKYRVVKL
jgi:hypothetical protein